MKKTNPRAKNSTPFSIIHTLVILITVLFFFGCSSGPSGDDDEFIITGIAATGAPIANAPIEIKSQEGKIFLSRTDNAGKYSSEKISEQGPYLVRVPLADSFFYSIGYANGTSDITVNLHPFTNLILRNWFSVTGTDIDTLFTNEQSTAALPSEQELQAIEAVVSSIIELALTPFIGDAEFDLFTSPFNADRTGFDAFLDNSNVNVTEQNISVLTTDLETNIESVLIDNIALNTDLVSDNNSLPSQPQNIRAGISEIMADSGEIIVSWDPSSDDKGIKGYQVFRNGELVATSPYLRYIDADLPLGSSYTYEVIALDSDDALSEKSASTTPVFLEEPDTIPPPSATGLTLNEVDGSVALSWQQSSLQDVFGFTVVRNMNELTTINSTTYTDSDITTEQTYCYQIITIDASRNASAPSEQRCISLGNSSPSIIQFTQGQQSVPEATGTLTVVVERTGNANDAVSVNYNTQGNTAAPTSDYTAVNGTLSWAENEVSAKSIDIQIINDNENEQDESFSINLSSPEGNAELGPMSSTILTIEDDDQIPSSVAFSSTQFSINESVGSATITVARSGNLAQAISVNYSALANSATDSVDFNATSGTLNWDANDDSVQSFNIQIINDMLNEPNETVTLSLSMPSESTSLGTIQSAELVIIDDDEQPSSVSLSESQYTAGEASGIATIIVERSGNISEAISVNYAITSDTATVTEDFEATSGTLNWPANNNEAQSFSIQIINDANDEPDETLNIALNMPSTNTLLGAISTAQLTIQDDDEPVVCNDLTNTTINIDTTLDQPCYNINADLVVSNNATLTIAPGTELVFADNTHLNVLTDGVLSASGTEQDPILFTSSTKMPGAWGGIEIQSSSTSTLDHITIEYGGSLASDNPANIGLSSSGSAAITNAVIQNSASYGIAKTELETITNFTNNVITANQRAPIRLDANSIGILDNTSNYTGNASTERVSQDFIEVTEVDITANQTWANLSVPYHFVEETNYEVRANLVIAAGSTLRFTENSAMRVQVDGELKAIGTDPERITFTSINDSPGSWLALVFLNTGGDNEIAFATIENGGSGGSASNLRVSQNTQLTVSNTIIRNSSVYGLNLDGPVNLSMSDTSISGNRFSVFADITNVSVLTTNNTYDGNTAADKVVLRTNRSLGAAQTFIDIGIPYEIPGLININAPLTIAEGTYIQFTGSGTGGLQINSGGSLSVLGTASNRVRLGSQFTTPGSWDGIVFSSSDNVNNIIEFTDIEYGGSASGTAQAMVRFSNSGSGPSTGRVTNTDFSSSETNGLWLDADTTGDFSTGNTFSDISGADTFNNP